METAPLLPLRTRERMRKWLVLLVPARSSTHGVEVEDRLAEVLPHAPVVLR